MRRPGFDDVDAAEHVSIPRRVSIYCDRRRPGWCPPTTPSQSPEGSRSIATQKQFEVALQELSQSPEGSRSIATVPGEAAHDPLRSLNPPKGLDLLRRSLLRDVNVETSLNPPKGLDLLRRAGQDDVVHVVRSQSPEGSRSIATPHSARPGLRGSLNPPKGLDLLRRGEPLECWPVSGRLNPPKGLDLLRPQGPRAGALRPEVSIPRRVSIYCDGSSPRMDATPASSQSPEGSRSIATQGRRDEGSRGRVSIPRRVSIYCDNKSLALGCRQVVSIPRRVSIYCDSTLLEFLETAGMSQSPEGSRSIATPEPDF